MARKRRQTSNLLASTLEAQAAMWVTLGVRVPQLLSGTMTAAEQHRMLAEKTAAAAEGAQAASAAVGRMMLNPWALHSPAAMMSGFATLSSAAANPFYSRVKANAKRLTGKRRASR